MNKRAYFQSREVALAFQQSLLNRPNVRVQLADVVPGGFKVKWQQYG